MLDLDKRPDRRYGEDLLNKHGFEQEHRDEGPAAATFIAGFKSNAKRLLTERKLPKDCYVELRDLSGKAELNGLVGRVRGYANDKDRYAVDVDPTSEANKAVLEWLNTEEVTETGIPIEDTERIDKEKEAVVKLSFENTSRLLLQRNLREMDEDLHGWTIRIARNTSLKKKPAMRNMVGGYEESNDAGNSNGGVPPNNPADEYPKTGERPVLFLAGFGISDNPDGSNFVTNAVLGKAPEKWKQWGCRYLDFEHSESNAAATKIVEAIESKEYNSIVLGDISDEEAFPRIESKLCEPLRKFVIEFGGNIAFATVQGDVMMDKLFPRLFPEITWRFGAYYRATHCAVQRNRANVARIFPGAEDWKFSVKGCMLDDVPDSEVYFATGQESKLFRYLEDDYDPCNDPDEHRRNTIVAVKQFPKEEGKNQTGHGGRVAYFGDVNGESECASLIVKFLESENASTDDMG